MFGFTYHFHVKSAFVAKVLPGRPFAYLGPRWCYQLPRFLR